MDNREESEQKDIQNHIKRFCVNCIFEELNEHNPPMCLYDGSDISGIRTCEHHVFEKEFEEHLHIVTLYRICYEVCNDTNILAEGITEIVPVCWNCGFGRFLDWQGFDGVCVLDGREIRPKDTCAFHFPDESLTRQPNNEPPQTEEGTTERVEVSPPQLITRHEDLERILSSSDSKQFLLHERKNTTAKAKRVGVEKKVRCPWLIHTKNLDMLSATLLLFQLEQADGEEGTLLKTTREGVYHVVIRNPLAACKEELCLSCPDNERLKDLYENTLAEGRT